MNGTGWMNNLSEQLIVAFDADCRKELSKSLSKAYLLSFVGAKEFGSFWRQAQSYLKWLYSDMLIEKSAKNLKIQCDVSLNAAKNSRHPTLHSNNWALTVHGIDSKGGLPREAKYRSIYSSLNRDLFEEIDDNVELINKTGGHVYLLHSGKNQAVSTLNLTVPTPDGSGIIYTESVAIYAPSEVEIEKVDDELDDKFKLLTETLLKQNEK